MSDPLVRGQIGESLRRHRARLGEPSHQAALVQSQEIELEIAESKGLTTLGEFGQIGLLPLVVRWRTLREHLDAAFGHETRQAQGIRIETIRIMDYQGERRSLL